MLLVAYFSSALVRGVTFAAARHGAELACGLIGVGVSASLRAPMTTFCRGFAPTARRCSPMRGAGMLAAGRRRF